MDDLSAILNRVLSDPESMRQLEEAAASLGLTGDGQNAAPAQYQASPPRPANRGMGMPGRRNTYQNKPPTPTRQREEELAEIRRLLEQLSGGKTPAPSPGTAYQPDYEPVEDNVPDIDVGAISDIIAGLTGKPRQAPASSPQDSGNLDLSTLLNSLGGQSQSHQQQTPDLSALLSGLAGQGNSPQQQGGNLDLSALLSSLGGQSQSRQQQTPDLSTLLSGLASQGQSSQQQGGNLDLSALLGSLGGGSGSGGGVDLSGLQGILSGLTGGGAPAAPSTASTLAAMLGGGGSDAGPIPGGMDMGMLLKFQQAMSSIGANAGNVRLLMAVKSHLKDEERREKVDDAIKVMQVVQFLPLLKESGLFGKMEEILDGFNLGGLLGGGRRSGSEGQGQGGFSLGNLFGGRNSSGGLGGLLSSLTGGR